MNYNFKKSSPSGKPTFSTSNTFKTKRTLKKILLSQSFKMGTGIKRFIQLRIKKVGSFCAGNKCWACGQKANLWCITFSSLLRDWFGGRNLKRCKMSMRVFIRKQDICGNCHVDHMRFRVHTASAHWVFWKPPQTDLFCGHSDRLTDRLMTDQRLRSHVGWLVQVVPSILEAYICSLPKQCPTGKHFERGKRPPNHFPWLS